MTKQRWVRDEHGRYEFPTPPDEETIVSLAGSILKKQARSKHHFTKPEFAKTWATVHLGLKKSEVFCCLFLNTKNGLIKFEEMFQGTIDGASVYPREIVKRALELNTAAVIFTHNHPSGDPEPSSADQALTRRLKSALALVDIRVIDHIIVGGGETVSLSERGLL